MCTHMVEAHPGEPMQAVVLKLVDDRFSALAEENRGDARKELDRFVETLAKANALHQETVDAREANSDHERRLAKREAQMEQKFNELLQREDRLEQAFTRLVGLANEHLEVTASEESARIEAEVMVSMEQKAQRLREIAKSDHDRRTKEAMRREIDALDAEDKGSESAISCSSGTEAGAPSGAEKVGR
jgi:hypothetical protein